jgi:hypothetical protein
MREALALLIPACAIGVTLLPRPVRGGRSLVAIATLTLCLGIGFSSLVSTALIVIGIAPTTVGFVVADVAIWASIGTLGWWTRRTVEKQAPGTGAESRESGAESPEPIGRLDWILRAAFGATAVVALFAVIASFVASPHGDWDAWAIWNQHARFLFRGGGSDTWRTLFAIDWTQPDYPLLLPASVARMWAYAGHESTLGPALIATVLGAGSVALVVTAIAGRRGWIAGALMLGAPTFLTQISSQCADVPLACFIVAALAVTCGDVLRDPCSRIPAVVAGATSAMAAWTKNEGIVFALLMLIVALAVAVRRSGRAGRDGQRRDGWRQLLWSMAGAAPALIAVVWFKLTLAPESGLVEGQSLTVFASRLLDPHRHTTVAMLMAQHAMRWSAPLAVTVFPLLCLVVAGMAIRGRAVRTMAAVVGLMLVSYYLVYVTTPFEISWHVSTSIDRLLVQLWPALVLTVFLVGLPSPSPGLESEGVMRLNSK